MFEINVAHCSNLLKSDVSVAPLVIYWCPKLFICVLLPIHPFFVYLVHGVLQWAITILYQRMRLNLWLFYRLLTASKSFEFWDWGSVSMEASLLNTRWRRLFERQFWSTSVKSAFTMLWTPQGSSASNERWWANGYLISRYRRYDVWRIYIELSNTIDQYNNLIDFAFYFTNLSRTPGIPSCISV